MFTLNVGFLGCNGERGKEKSKVKPVGGINLVRI